MHEQAEQFFEKTKNGKKSFICYVPLLILHTSLLIIELQNLQNIAISR